MQKGVLLDLDYLVDTITRGIMSISVDPKLLAVAFDIDIR